VRVIVVADVSYGISYYYYTVQLYWNGVVMKTTIIVPNNVA